MYTFICALSPHRYNESKLKSSPTKEIETCFNMYSVMYKCQKLCLYYINWRNLRQRL